MIIETFNWDTLRKELHLPIEILYDPGLGIYPQVILSSGNLEWQINYGDDDNLTIDFYDGSSTTTYIKLDKTNNIIQVSFPINMNSKKITNLAEPTASSDATTKNYVDTQISSKRYYTTTTIPSSSPYTVDITHNLNDPAPVYAVYDDSTGEQIIPLSATVVDNNTLRLEFSSEDAGKTIRVKVIV